MSAIINVTHSIWYCRYQNIQLRSAINRICAATSFSGNISKGCMYFVMDEFLILKAFKVNIHPCKAPIIKQVDWHPPFVGWIKCNSDGASRGNPGISACGVIFRYKKGVILGCFSYSIGVSSSFYAELMAAMIAIELAWDKGWRKLWLECDSTMVLKALSSFTLVPWKIRNRWLKCLSPCKHTKFQASHIYREGNHCADKLASFGLSGGGFSWWDLHPSFILEDFNHNRFNLPNFRFK